MQSQRSSYKLGIVTLACCAYLQTAEVFAQFESFDQGPTAHSARSWDDPLFRARVQGVYDWIGSGPDRLSQMDYLIQQGDVLVRESMHFYRRSTANRDTDTFPPRVQIDPEAVYVEPPKDWVDREALISYMRDNETMATDFFQERVSDQPNADTWFLLGNVLFLQARYTEATESYREAIDRFSNFRLAYQNLAYTELILENYEAALTAANMAIGLGAMSGFIKGAQAYAALQTNRLNTSVEAIAVALMIEPDNAAWRQLQQEAMLRSGREEQLVKLFSQSSAGDVVPASRLTALAQSYRNQGQSGELAAILEIKRRALQASEEEQSELSTLQSRSQKRSENLATNAIASNENQLHEANILFADGNSEAALTAVREELEQSPTSCEALMLHAEIHNALERYEEVDSALHRLELLSQSCFRETLPRQAQLYLDRSDWPRALQSYQLDQRQREISGELVTPRYRSLVQHLTNLVRLASSTTNQ